jgi:hypothetical protein
MNGNLVKPKEGIKILQWNVHFVTIIQQKFTRNIQGKTIVRNSKN